MITVSKIPNSGSCNSCCWPIDVYTISITDFGGSNTTLTIRLCSHCMNILEEHIQALNKEK